ncbi:MAG: pyridoxamine 5'-phosphate oxidase [Glaciecola sp.]
MKYPLWRQRLVRSLHLSRAKPESRFIHVANVDQQGFAQNRTMVFRGFQDESLNLLAITDIRSDKVIQWHGHPYAHISWYFAKSREQYRLRCDVVLVTQENANSLANDKLPINKTNSIRMGFSSKGLIEQRDKMWNSLSSAAKSQFTWPSPKFAPEDNKLSTELADSENALPSSDCVELPHENYALVIFIPRYVDYLDLKTTPQCREISQEIGNSNSQKQACWQHASVNP